jgi:hypothetical protein
MCRTRGKLVNADGTPARDATVAVGAGEPVKTDDEGRFDSPACVRGGVTLRLRSAQLAYASLWVPVEGEPASWYVTMDRAYAGLGAVVVGESDGGRLSGTGFNERRRSRAGAFFTSSDIRARPPERLVDLLATVPGAHLTGTSLTFTRSAESGPATCTPQVIADGRPVPVALDRLPPRDVLALEIYPEAGGVPSPFRPFAGTCGVIVLWTIRR